MHTSLTVAALGLCAGLCNASSKLFHGGTIVAFDSDSESLRVIRNGSLLVTDDRIAGVYESNATLSNVPNGTERIDVSHQIVTPGFIDTHRHGWQTALKTLGSNTSLAEYLLRYGEFAAQPNYTPEDVYIGQLAGLYEALNAGVTTTLDHAHHTWSNETSYAGLNASIESGARVFWSYALHDVPGYSYSEQMANFRDMAESDLLEGSPTELGLAFDYWSAGLEDELVEEIVDLALEHASVLTTHLVSGPWGFENVPSALHRYNILNTSVPVVFSHGSYISATDIQLLRRTNQYISITPESEMHYGHTHEESFYIVDQGSLGVDTHFTFSTDILTQARLWLQHARYRFYNYIGSQFEVPSTNPMSVAQAFKLATRAGGLALRRPDLGIIEVGAKADLVVWNARDSPALLGWVDPVAAVILHASVGDILHVTVDGNFVKRDGRLVAPEYPAVRERFLASAERIQAIWRDEPIPVIEGPALSGFDQVPTRQVDSQRGNGTGYGEVFI
ncbi:hypothetical protein S40288_07149 [Stachybotrys chartarum IBT 40288]|nr:hypothetical protein S40288_07149 [Stachybotrys chartarum IBT 40288]